MYEHICTTYEVYALKLCPVQSGTHTHTHIHRWQIVIATGWIWKAKSAKKIIRSMMPRLSRAPIQLYCDEDNDNILKICQDKDNKEQWHF